MDFITVLKIIKAIGLIFIGTGFILYAVVKIKELKNGK